MYVKMTCGVKFGDIIELKGHAAKGFLLLFDKSREDKREAQ